MQHGCDWSMLLPAQVITGELTEEEYNRLWETNMAGSFGLSKRLATVINEGALSAGTACSLYRSLYSAHAGFLGSLHGLAY